MLVREAADRERALDADVVLGEPAPRWLGFAEAPLADALATDSARSVVRYVHDVLVSSPNSPLERRCEALNDGVLVPGEALLALLLPTPLSWLTWSGATRVGGEGAPDGERVLDSRKSTEVGSGTGSESWAAVADATHDAEVCAPRTSLALSLAEGSLSQMVRSSILTNGYTVIAGPAHRPAPPAQPTICQRISSVFHPHFQIFTAVKFVTIVL